MKTPESNNLSLFDAIIDNRSTIIAMASTVVKTHFAAYPIYVSYKDKTEETL